MHAAVCITRIIVIYAFYRCAEACLGLDIPNIPMSCTLFRRSCRGDTAHASVPVLRSSIHLSIITALLQQSNI